MFTAQPSTYDMFALIELYGRTVESVRLSDLLCNEWRERKFTLIFDQLCLIRTC